MLIREHRLVTLTGTGGIGKTRIGLQVAECLISAWPNGVWLTELARVSDAALVANAVGRSVAVEESVHRPMLETIIETLKRRSLLLILDNCEHVIEETGRIAASILRECPDVRILATSREALRLTGEQVYYVPSLRYPDAPVAGLAAAGAYPSVMLFADRARAADAQFHISDENADAVGRICRQLDGVPLAIELAAARVRMLTLTQIEQMLARRFTILTGGDQTATPRQRTMRATLDWSHELLCERDRVLFRRLGIFSGGWSFEALETVCGGEALEPGQVLPALSSLVEKSLVTTTVNVSEMRYRLLESTREYALQKLEDSGERGTLNERHARWVSRFAAWADDMLWCTSIEQWLTLVEVELENARAALQWALGASGDVTVAARIVGGFDSLWYYGGFFAEGSRWIDRTVAQLRADGRPITEAGLLHALGTIGIGAQAVAAADAVISLCTRNDDRRGAARGFWRLAVGYRQERRLRDAEAAADQALAIYCDLHLERSPLYARALHTRGSIAKELGQIDKARAFIEGAIALFQMLDDYPRTGPSRVLLSEIEFQSGNTRKAVELADEAVRMCEGGFNAIEQAQALCHAAAYRLAAGEIEAAEGNARKALLIACRTGARWDVAAAIEHIANASAVRGRVREAALLSGYVDAWYHSDGAIRESSEQVTFAALKSKLHRELSAELLARLVFEGSRLGQGRAVEIALAHFNHE
jgi:predicted ATPase